MIIKLGQLCTIIENDPDWEDELQNLPVDLTGYDVDSTTLYKHATIKSLHTRTNGFTVCTKYSCQKIFYYMNEKWSSELADALEIPKTQTVVGDQYKLCSILTHKGLPCRQIRSKSSLYCFQHPLSGSDTTGTGW